MKSPTPSGPDNQEEGSAGPSWPETCDTWLVDLGAAGEIRRKSLCEQLARNYRRPVLNRIRQIRPGLSAPDAEDLCHEFFHRDVFPAGTAGRTLFDRFDPSKGRLRDYIGRALRNFLFSSLRDDNRDKRRALRSARQIESIPEAESSGLPDPATQCANDIEFDRDWALTIQSHAFRRLDAMYRRTPERAARYTILRPWLIGEPSPVLLKEAAASLGLSPNALSQALRTLRRDLREAMVAAVAPTVAHPREIEDELRYLCEVLRQ